VAERQIADDMAHDLNERAARGERCASRCHAREDVGRLRIDPVKRCVKRADAAARQHLLDGGEAMAVADPVDDRVKARDGDGQGHVPGLGRGHEAARLGVEDRAGVEAGAQAHHRVSRAWGEWIGLRQHLDQVLRRDMPDRMALRLQVVQNGGFFGGQHAGQALRSMRQSRLVSCTTPSRTGPAPATQTP
jgi:hypothetical protein